MAEDFLSNLQVPPPPAVTTTMLVPPPPPPPGSMPPSSGAGGEWGDAVMTDVPPPPLPPLPPPPPPGSAADAEGTAADYSRDAKRARLDLNGSGDATLEGDDSAAAAVLGITRPSKLPVVRLYTLNSVVSHSLKAPGFNPRAV
jgi:hypothetical protein